jgi:hypothetical protein
MKKIRGMADGGVEKSCEKKQMYLKGKKKSIMQLALPMLQERKQ